MGNRYFQFLFIVLFHFARVKTESLSKTDYYSLHEEACRELGRNPFFDIDMVVGKPWRIYYSWYMELENKCVDLQFWKATQTIINRFYNDMFEYLEQQPVWSAATLYMTLGKAQHETLLFDDQGPAGRFVAVLNYMREGIMAVNKNEAPLLSFQLKLVAGGKFLIVMDCKIGVTILAARSDDLPYSSEILSLALDLNIKTNGTEACLRERNKEESIAYASDNKRPE